MRSLLINLKCVDNIKYIDESKCGPDWETSKMTLPIYLILRPSHV